MSRDPFQAQVLAPSTAPAASGTAPAVEIVTALGDSVLGVDQLSQAPARSSRARLMMMIGSGLLLAAATTFALGVRDASREARAREQWRAEERPAWAFRPERPAVSADLLALGGALAGIGLCAAGLLARRRPQRDAFRVGVGESVDVPLADAGRQHTLVKADGQGGFVIDLSGLSGELRAPGRVTPLADLQASGQLELPVRVDTHVRARVGRTTFHIRGLQAPSRPVGPAPIFASRTGLGFLAGSAAAHVALLGVMTLAGPDQESVAGEMRVDDDSYMHASIESFEDPTPPTPEDGDSDGGEAVPSEAPSMALTTGTLGHADGSNNPARLKVADRGMPPQMSREMAIAIAARSGVVGAFENLGPVRVFDGASIASGMDDLDITGGMLDGNGNGAPVGTFGWGVSGFGTGCGTADNKLCQGFRAGPFATIGEESDANGRNFRMLAGDGNGPGKRVTRGPRVAEIGRPTACSEDEPCLDPAIIRRYIHRNIEKISYCYEKQLLGNPELEGTVTANFTLNGNGVVIDSRAAGVDPTVSSCIAGVISHISFPKVGGTGIYPIRYPFALRPTGK